MKTAVEWLVNILRNKHGISIDLYSEFNQAKEMEKGQHQETWDVAHQAGRFEGKGIAEENWFTFEEYWEEEPKCTCSKGKGIDFDEMELAYCVSCQKEIN